MEDEPKAAQPEKIDWQKLADDAAISRYGHFQGLARRMLSQDGTDLNFTEAEVRHLTEMLFLIDISTGHTAFWRFRSRYGGNY